MVFSLRRDVTQVWVLCGELQHVHSGQGQKIPKTQQPSVALVSLWAPAPLSSAIRGCSRGQMFPRSGHFTVWFSSVVSLSSDGATIELHSSRRQRRNWEIIETYSMYQVKISLESIVALSKKYFNSYKQRLKISNHLINNKSRSLSFPIFKTIY